MGDVKKTDRELLAEYRGDLIKRLFAVAISIGVGAALITTDWVKEGRIPNVLEAEQIVIVVVALFATVLSWDGYLISIHNKPLYDRARFAIDVVLVFTYLFLIVTSRHKSFWLPIICWMFFLYVCWDALTIRQFPSVYDKKLVPNSRPSFWLIPKIYALGALDQADIDRGPIITFSWAIFFILLTLTTRYFPQFNVFVACIFATLGLIVYRRDKAHIDSGVRGLGMPFRISLILLLLVTAIIYGCYSSRS